MAGITGTQDLWIVGSRFFFEKVKDSNILVDIGIIETVSPQMNPKVVELKDSASGIRRLVDNAITQIDETYDIQCKNFNMSNLTTMFMGGAWQGTAKTESLSTTPVNLCPIRLSVEDVNNIGMTAAPVVTGTGGNYLVQLRHVGTATAYGEPYRNVSANETVVLSTEQGTTDAAWTSTHWEWYDKTKGIIKIKNIPTGVAVGTSGVAPNWAGQLLTVANSKVTGASTAFLVINVTVALGSGTETHTTYAANRLMYPQTGSISTFSGTGHLFSTRDNGVSVDKRQFPCQILPGTVAINNDDYSMFNLSVTVLATGNASQSDAITNPAGIYLQGAGLGSI